MQSEINTIIANCQRTADNCRDTIAQQLSAAVGNAYRTHQQLGASVRDNLAYLLSEAQQYAGILGYPVSGISVPSGIDPASVTADVIDPSNPTRIIANQPLTDGDVKIVPRDVGWQSGDIRLLQVPTYPGLPVSGPGGYPIPAVSGLSYSGSAGESPTSPVSGMNTGQPGVGGLGALPVASAPNATTPGITNIAGSPPATISPASKNPATGIGLPTAGATGSAAIRSSFRGGKTGSQGNIGITPTPVNQLSSAPTSSGCPTSVTGLTTWQQIQDVAVIPRSDLYLNINNAVWVLKPFDPLGSAFPDFGYLTSDGVNQFTAVPCNYLENPPPVTPVPAQPPAQPSESCDTLTPWQKANCLTGTIATPEPSTVSACPTPTINLNVDQLCECIRQVASGSNLTPVDLDQPLAFKLAPDDAAWKANALAYVGDWLLAYNASDSDEQYLEFIDSGIPTPQPISEAWQ